jgi:transcriptional regulator with XRE-family HTH domain
MREKGQVPAVAERLGENLRRVRRREGLSQERLAVRASLHRTAIGLLENGQRVCRTDTLIQLAGAMEVAPGELLEGIDWVAGPETQGTFTFASTSVARRAKQLSSPAIDEAG